jgi:hypothetical protein
VIARTPARQFSVILALVIACVLVPAALAAKGAGGGAGGGGGHKPGGGGSTGTGTLAGPVLLNSTDGTAHYGQNVTFKVTSTAQYYFVRADCYQNGVQVWETTEGFYSGWLWGTTYTLAGMVWKGGAANCTAVLYDQSVSGTNQHTEASISFNVAA